MAKLPTDLSGLEVRAALERAGFVFRRQKGSHMTLRRDHLTPEPLFRTTSNSAPARSAASSATPGSRWNSSCACSDDDDADEKLISDIMAIIDKWSRRMANPRRS